MLYKKSKSSVAKFLTFEAPQIIKKYGENGKFMFSKKAAKIDEIFKLTVKILSTLVVFSENKNFTSNLMKE